MSASREKKARQERGADYLSPKQQKALEEQKSARRTTIIFAACAAVFVVAVAAMLLWNSGVFQRGAAAASVNGKTYTAADVAYYYYNGRANLINGGSVSSSASLREQEYTGSEEGFATWYDYLADQAVKSLAGSELTAQIAKDEGFDGGSAVDETVNDTIASLETAAASSGYSISGYLKAIFGSLMTRSVFERSLRTAALADAYTTAKSDVSGYTDAELNAVYDAEPNAYSMVSSESAVFLASDYAPAEDAEAAESETEEADDGTAAALAAADGALVRVKAGEGLETVADELDADNAAAHAYYAESSEIAQWLFDDARRDGDATVLDYTYYGYRMGSVVLVYHGKERADFHAVDVRHILVSDEETANDVLAQYLAGEQTEEAFAALARENSTDNADDGGLYEGVYIGQMVKPFEDWCFDSARKTGDTGIVETSYGYHVMYFVDAHSAVYWQELAAAKLANDWADSLSADISTELLSGMKYIDP